LTPPIQWHDVHVEKKENKEDGKSDLKQFIIRQTDHRSQLDGDE
jgi:hypothetical protein